MNALVAVAETRHRRAAGCVEDLAAVIGQEVAAAAGDDVQRFLAELTVQDCALGGCV